MATCVFAKEIKIPRISAAIDERHAATLQKSNE
jgi:hypothetical protein